MYPIWLLVAFFVGTLDCIPHQGIFNTCPGIKTSKLVHAEFLTGCATKNTGTVSDKLCTLYEEILKQLCTLVKDKKIAFSDTDIEKALQSTDPTKVCDILRTFKLDDVTRTKEILLPVTDYHCFRTCVSDDYKILPICNYGAYMVNFIHATSSNSDLEDGNLKKVQNNISINATSNVLVPKTDKNNLNVGNSSTSEVVSYTTIKDNNTQNNKKESKPDSPLLDNVTREVVDEKKTIIETTNDKPNNPIKSNVHVSSGTQANPLRDSNLSKHGDNPVVEHNPVVSTEEGSKKNSQSEQVSHIINNGSNASNVLSGVDVSSPVNLSSGKPTDPQDPKIEPSKQEKQKLDEQENVAAINPQEVVNSNGVSEADDTLKQQNSQGKNKDVVSVQEQNIDMVNPQEPLQSEDNDDLEDEDSELEPPNDIMFTNEAPKTTNDLKPKPNTMEKKPIKTEYSDKSVLQHSYKTENSDDGDSYFFSYFMVICLVFIGGYVIYHNKQRILALIVEGRKGRRNSRSRRPNSANYKKLDSNLEEAISSSCNKSATHVIY